MGSLAAHAAVNEEKFAGASISERGTDKQRVSVPITQCYRENIHGGSIMGTGGGLNSMLPERQLGNLVVNVRMAIVWAGALVLAGLAVGLLIPEWSPFQPKTDAAAQSRYFQSEIDDQTKSVDAQLNAEKENITADRAALQELQAWRMNIGVELGKIEANQELALKLLGGVEGDGSSGAPQRRR
jgi:hypothetical protein